MRKSLVVLAMVLLGFGVWWTLQSGETGSQGDGLEQAALVPDEQVAPDVQADLATPDTREREGSSVAPVDQEQGAGLEVEEPEAPQTEENTLPNPTLTVRALIVNWDNQPVRDTYLNVSYHALPRGSDPAPPQLAHYSTQSNAEGLIQLELQLPHYPLELIAIQVADQSRQARGWVEPVKVIVDGRGHLGNIQIFEAMEKSPEALVRGRVLTEDGTPASDVRGYIYPVFRDGFEVPRSFEQLPHLWTGRDSGQVVIADDGSFVAYGPSSESAVQMIFFAFDNGAYVTTGTAFTPPFEVPTSDLQVILHGESRFEGKLKVPELGPPIGEYVLAAYPSALAHPKLANPDGGFSLHGTKQAKSIRVYHSMSDTVLFEHKLGEAPTGITTLGTLDIAAEVEVVDLIVTDMSGEPRANQKVEVHTQGVGRAVGHAMTDADGRLLTVVPKGVSVISLVRGNRENVGQGAAVEVDLAAAPGRVMLP